MILKILLKKGIITEKEYQEAKEELSREKMKEGKVEKTEETEQKETLSEEIFESLSIEGSLYGEARWMKNRDITDPESDSTSDLYLRKLELGIEAGLTDWLTATAVLNSEWIGDDINQGDEKIAVDEATISLETEGSPLYLIIGKRTQPFGIFENHLITDPMTQDAYETKRMGITAGYTGLKGLALSLTLYKGDEQMSHLFESGIFDSDTLLRKDGDSDEVSSFILSGMIAPVNSVTLFASYLSESGRGTRNRTINLGASIVSPFIEGLRFDAEYMKALNRELYSGLDTEYKEGVFSITTAYEFVVRERKSLGGGLFAERRTHLIKEPLEVALRYEHFDDDGMSDDIGVWTVKDRYSAGARYSFYNDEETGLNAFLAGEYRHTTYRKGDNDMKGKNNEAYVRVGVDF